jgi:tetratricopeptide (TPR) repeat protein
VDALHLQASAWSELGRDDGDAEALYVHAHEACTASLGGAHLHSVAAAARLGGLYQATGRPALALPLLEVGSRHRESPLGAHLETPSEQGFTSALDSVLALGYHLVWFFTYAFRQAVAAADAGVAVGGDAAAAESQRSLGKALLGMGLRALAATALERALAAKKLRLGEQHPELEEDLRELAELYLASGKYDQAECVLTQQLKLVKRARGGDHADTAEVLNGLGRAAKLQVRFCRYRFCATGELKYRGAVG